MDDLTRRSSSGHDTLPLTLRDLAAPVFRQRRLALLIFLGVFFGAVLGGLFVPRKFEAEMKILVNRDRVDTVVTPNPNAAEVVAPVPAVSEEDINSEVELLKSRDLLENVVVASGSDARKLCVGPHRRASRRPRPCHPLDAGVTAGSISSGPSESSGRGSTQENNSDSRGIRVARPGVISARTSDAGHSLPGKAAAVHRPAGAFTFSINRPATIGTSLSELKHSSPISTAAKMSSRPPHRNNWCSSSLANSRHCCIRTNRRLGSQRSGPRAPRPSLTGPDRQITQIRKLDNPQLLAQLESTLLSLELKRSEMLAKYAPSYPPVREVETQIEETRTAIAQARQAPDEEITTDRRRPRTGWRRNSSRPSRITRKLKRRLRRRLAPCALSGSRAATRPARRDAG